MTKTELDFFPEDFFLICWRPFFCNVVKGNKICKLTEMATETSQTSEVSETPVTEVGLADTKITVMQYECLLFMTASAFINCKCSLCTASHLSRIVVEMCLAQKSFVYLNCMLSNKREIRTTCVCNLS